MCFSTSGHRNECLELDSIFRSVLTIELCQPLTWTKVSICQADINLLDFCELAWFLFYLKSVTEIPDCAKNWILLVENRGSNFRRRNMPLTQTRRVSGRFLCLTLCTDVSPGEAKPMDSYLVALVPWDPLESKEDLEPFSSRFHHSFSFRNSPLVLRDTQTLFIQTAFNTALPLLEQTPELRFLRLPA